MFYCKIKSHFETHFIWHSAYISFSVIPEERLHLQPYKVQLSRNKINIFYNIAIVEI